MRFEVIYADPAWSFDTKVTGGNFKSGASQKYPTMPLPEIHALPVPAVSAHHAVCFLWVPTALKFSHGGTTLTAWGFDYITTVYWDKMKLGMGHWFRNEVEELLVGKRRGGDPAPFKCQLPNIIHKRPGEHSAKPDEFKRLIETATGYTLPRQNLEMFARTTDPAWTGIGNMVTGNDLRVDMRTLALMPEGGMD